MPRTTIDIDATVLRQLKARQRAEGGTLGQLASELLSAALRKSVQEQPPPFRWTARPMGARVDLEDKEAVRRALDDHP
jgi:hypothetical protein